MFAHATGSGAHSLDTFGTCSPLSTSQPGRPACTAGTAVLPVRAPRLLQFLDGNASRRGDGRQLLLLLLRHLCHYPLSHLRAVALQTVEVTTHVFTQKPTSAAVTACTCFAFLGLFAA